jgi:RNA ligase (TIGR02306 family)
MNEKIHGTLLQVGVLPVSMGKEKYYEGRVVLSSKGLGRQGLILDHADETNLYAMACKKYDLLNKALALFGDEVNESGLPVWLFGEVFGVMPSGKVVQDLTYGGAEVGYRLFDVARGPRSDPKFAEWMKLQNIAIKLGVAVAPPYYVGPFTQEALDKHTNGAESVSGKSAHMREGVVVKHLFEQHHPKYGRRIAKSLSEAYLLRKGETTEHQ